MLFVTGGAQADPLNVQRQRYQEIKAAWDNNKMDEVKRLMPTLKSYPLYPYLEYRQISQDMSQLTVKQVDDFLATHPTLPSSRSLQSNFLNELARREDWKGFLHFASEPPKSLSQRCNYYYAKWSTGNKTEALAETSGIWLSSSSLPDDCDKLFAVWRSAGKQTPQLVLQRIRLTSEAGSKESKSLATYLTKQLSGKDKLMGEEIVKLHANPTSASVEAFAKKYTPTDFTREVTYGAFSRLARQNTDTARTILPKLARDQKMSEQQTLRMEKVIASRLMGNDVLTESAIWRDKVIARSQDTSLIERRIRLALNIGDMDGVAKWLAVLPESAKQKEEWRYWYADSLLNKGKKAEGERILKDLMVGRGFYPMVSAQRLGLPYILKMDVAPKPDQRLAELPEVKRVNELLYWQLENQARSEWIGLVSRKSKPEQEALARYAFERNWADLSVQATIAAKLWDHLEERFPVAYGQLFEEAVKDREINQTFAMAIARQESAWNPQAQSPVGARGLMQLMPKTAQETAKKAQFTDYKGTSQLFDPETNIHLGTSYLDFVFQNFDNNRILAAAAYNAGPHRVNTWLANSAGRINAIAFVESIPFNETRGYVKNVLSYDVFYRYFTDKQQAVLTDEEWRRVY